MNVSIVSVTVDASALERECDSLRAEMGFTRKVLNDALSLAKRKPCPKNAKRLEDAQEAHAEAVELYRAKAEELFVVTA